MGRAPPWGCYPWALEEFQYLLRIRRRRPGLGRCSSLVRAYMPEDLCNQRRVLDTGDDPQFTAKRHQVLVPAAVALDAQEAVFEQPALQIVFELLADEPGQVTAGAFDLLHEA